MKKNKIKISTNRSFGIVFFIFFFIIAVYPLINNGDIRIWSIIIALTFLILGLFNSRILTPLNKIWFRFGILLGNLISPIIMGIIFFLIITPTSFIMKILGKNLLNLKRNNKNSYWVERPKIKSKMKNQF